MDDGAFFALGAVGLVVVGYFLYQQQEDTQILLVKSLSSGSKSIVQEAIDVGKTAFQLAALI